MTPAEFATAFAGIFVVLSLGMTAAWLAWVRTGNAGWVDLAWTVSLGLTGILGTTLAPGVLWRHVAISILLIIWVQRLGLHIAERNVRRRDDPRYAKLVESWGADASRQMFWLLQKQAWVSVPLALALVLAAAQPAEEFRLLDGLGLLVVALAIVGEALSDWQLKQFQSNHDRGAICDVGLWSLSRHPNYFFQWLSWCGYALIALDFTGAYLWGWLALAAPACMYWLLMFVSGIPPLEEHMLATRGAPYREYQSHTHAFFPLPKKA